MARRPIADRLIASDLTRGWSRQRRALAMLSLWTLRVLTGGSGGLGESIPVGGLENRPHVGKRRDDRSLPTIRWPNRARR
jgi:hypothetical protein